MKDKKEKQMFAKILHAEPELTYIKGEYTFTGLPDDHPLSKTFILFKDKEGEI